MEIRKYWLNTQEYTILEAAYLVCGLEPENETITPPQIVTSVYTEIKNSIVEHNQELIGKPVNEYGVDINFVRSWADYIGETDFFKLEPAQIDKPLTANESDKKRKKLKPLQKERNQALLLIYELLKSLKIEYLDELSGLYAWSKIVDGEFKSNLIKSVSETKKIIMLNGGEKLNKGDFLEKYRKRFKLE